MVASCCIAAPRARLRHNPISIQNASRNTFLFAVSADAVKDAGSKDNDRLKGNRKLSNSLDFQ